MKDNQVELDIRGIKCDNVECDFIDMSVKLEEYEKWINKPCPKCGSILLTQADYDNVKMLIRMSKIVNDSLRDINDSKNREVDCDKKIRVEMNGTGSMKFEELK